MGTNSTSEELKKFYLEKCFENVRSGAKTKLMTDLMDAMGIKSRMTLYRRRKRGFIPKRGEDEKVLAVLKQYKVKQYLIEA